MKKLILGILILVLIFTGTKGFAAVTSETYKTIFACDNSTTTFDFDFKVFDEEDLEVIVMDENGTETELTYETNYTVANLTAEGGEVTTNVTYPENYTLIVRRSQGKTQDSDFTHTGILSTEVLEVQLDKIVMMIQQQQEQIDRSLLQASDQNTSITFPTPTADYVIGWNSEGTGLENKLPMDADSVSACLAAQNASEVAQAAAEAAETNATAAAAKIPDPDVGNATKGIVLDATGSSYEFADLATQVELDAKFNITSGHDHDGTDSKKLDLNSISGIFGTLNTSVSTNTTYQAPTDGIVIAYTAKDGSSKELKGLTDSSNPPTTVYQNEYDDPSTNSQLSIVFPIKKDNYWKVEVSGTTATVKWLPTGS